MNKIKPTDLADRIEQLIAETRKRTVVAVNTAMVYTYFEIGRMIVEDEQQGEIRAGYGKTILKDISSRLNNRFGKGFSVDNLENMRKFYLVYSKSETPSRISENYPQISETPSRISSIVNSATPLRNSEKGQTPSAPLPFTLSWSHYLKLMRIENPDERRFYEIEATENNWSLRELQRQSLGARQRFYLCGAASPFYFRRAAFPCGLGVLQPFVALFCAD